MSERDEIADELSKLGFCGGKQKPNVKPLPEEGGPTLTMFRPTAYVRIEDPADLEHFNRILQKMAKLHMFLPIENGDDDDDGFIYGPPQGTGSYTINGCVDDSDI